MNPIIKNRKALAVYIFAWLFVAFLHTTILYNILNFELKFAIVDSLIFNLIYSTLALSYWYSIKYISLENFTVIKILTNHITAAVISSIVWIIAASWILSKIFDYNDNYTNFLFDSLIWRFFLGILFYTIIISIFYGMLYYSNFHNKILKEAELKGLVKEAELKSLKYQINPHFIFNSLNSISALTVVKPELAQEMTIKLSNFLRKTLKKNDNQFQALKEELDNAKLYLDIEKIRFEDKLIYSENFDEKCINIKVPSMILQPLFENAIKHGLHESINAVNIIFTCKKENDYVKITLENNFDADAVTKKGEGIGLTNIKSRLQKIYKQTNLLKIEKRNDNFKVTIYIPLQGEGNEK
jgi:sensor histidine kinase YesM